MSNMYLAIEGDDAVHERESQFWLSRMFTAVRAFSICEAIKLVLNNDYLFIGINADNINYNPILRVLRDATIRPIFIVSSNYTKQEAGEAYCLGADLFEPASNRPEDNFKTKMGKLQSLYMRTKSSLRKSQKPQEIISFDDIIFNTSYRTVFIKDKELKLSRVELDVLQYMMDNPIRILTHDTICERFLKVEYGAGTPDAIYNLIKRLRKKIIKVSQFDYIYTVSDVGYQLIKRDGNRG